MGATVVAHRRYYFEHPGPWNQEGSWQRIRELLEYQTGKRWWFNDPEVEGEPFGRLAFSITISGDDQWQVHRRAIALAAACYRKIGLKRADIPVPLWESLEHPSKSRKLRQFMQQRQAMDDLLRDLHKR